MIILLFSQRCSTVSLSGECGTSQELPAYSRHRPGSHGTSGFDSGSKDCTHYSGKFNQIIWDFIRRILVLDNNKIIQQGWSLFQLTLGEKLAVPWRGYKSTTGPKQRDRTHTNTILESAVNLICMLLHCGSNMPITAPGTKRDLTNKEFQIQKPSCT